ncbi:uncharacterized protein PAC_01757 [Phialocephala subalpina]|uniref:J domain-containing protein n=1 Tax=Phialocephala subalpina TaxID=576137 RepID=A0A1L7WGG8_9HELO|nr:uncharacterized protein PAC_01757 [Phialocephala subalpina]
MATRRFDRTYYESLNVSPNVSAFELKKAYRHAAPIHHPDKTPGDKQAQHRFQEGSFVFQISKAYQGTQQSTEPCRKTSEDYVLISVSSAQRYSFASTICPRRESSSRERWRTWTVLRDAKKFRIYLQHDKDIVPAAKADVGIQRQTESERRRKILEVSMSISHKIEYVVLFPKDLAKAKCLKWRTQKAAESMKLESFGDQLLQTINRVFVSYGRAFIDSWPIIGPVMWYLRECGRDYRETIDFLSSGVEAKQALDATKKAEDQIEVNERELSEEHKLLAGKVLPACWKITVKEVHDILRRSDVCTCLLYDEDIPQPYRVRRVNVLVMIGQIFVPVSAAPELMSWIWVHRIIDSKESRRRDGGADLRDVGGECIQEAVTFHSVYWAEKAIGTG